MKRSSAPNAAAMLPQRSERALQDAAVTGPHESAGTGRVHRSGNHCGLHIATNVEKKTPQKTITPPARSLPTSFRSLAGCRDTAPEQKQACACDGQRDALSESFRVNSSRWSEESRISLNRGGKKTGSVDNRPRVDNEEYGTNVDVQRTKRGDYAPPETHLTKKKN